MDSNTRYHLLQNETEDEGNVSLPQSGASHASFPENVLNTEIPSAVASNSNEVEVTKVSANIPPDYNVATDLPTYEDVERAKFNEERQKLQDEADLMATESALLGTDFLFFTSFFISFLFNWMGFLLVLCFCHTVAGRYGALAGFGLSLSKWMLIVKHSTNLMSHENDWLWWLILAFGLLICVRASLQYFRAKREWRHLSSNAQERLFYFY